MIISNNKTSSTGAFNALMQNTDARLNNDAKTREAYYVTRTGKLLEKDVYDALCQAAVGTEFDGSIKLISGASFPDIVVNNYFGVEVKSTEKDHWTSIGSSILESTRDVNVERIYLTFGKLGRPVEFRSRPYEECLSGIAVTHYPRYQINMQLPKGETIFDKMNLSYDKLRTMDNPVAPVSQYYRSLLKSGESLWWAADNADAVSPAKVSLWTALSSDERERLTAQGYALFPEILFSKSTKKYNRYALWLATVKGVVNTNIRDSFSAGGKVEITLKTGIVVPVCAALGRIKAYRNLIIETIANESEDVLAEYWEVDHIEENRINQWYDLIAASTDKGTIDPNHLEILRSIFFD